MTTPDNRVTERTDPDIHLKTPAGRLRPGRRQASVVAVVAIGGALGAAARYGAGLAWPTPPDAFPWTTLAINTTGCAVIGVFMALITDVWAAHRLLRPFIGTGILGGYTTFSTYAVDIARLISAGHARTGLTYLVLTLLAALAAVWAAAAGTRALIMRSRP